MRRLALAALCLLARPALAQQWIWGGWAEGGPRPERERAYFRKLVTLVDRPARATAWISADDHFTLFVNGERVADGHDWKTPRQVDLAPHLAPGDNVLALSALNERSWAGLAAVLVIERKGAPELRIETDASWLSAREAAPGWHAPARPPGEWLPARAIAALGAAPWGPLALGPARPLPRPGSPDAPGTRKFEPAAGFRVETVAEGLGSLLALAVAPGGRIYVAVESGGVLGLDDDDDDGRIDRIEPVLEGLFDIHGLAVAGGALYVVGHDDRRHYGLYRLDLATRKRTRLGRFAVKDAGHGAHAVVPGPDGRIYVSLGNHTTLDEPAAADSPYRLSYEGHPLAPYPDPRGYGAEVRAPGGTIVSLDPASGAWRVFAGGLRNVYDFAFNRNGDLIAFDSDMEWDLGLPWYRPVHALHVVPGGEYGSRSGSAVWPFWYADTLPRLLEIGRGSPTGVALVDRGGFPARLQGSLLAGDWAQGTIFALKLEPRGTSYGGSIEVLARGAPLNVCDLALDRDGSLLFVTGGRQTIGGVYRLRHVGEPERAPADPFVAPAARVALTPLMPDGEVLALLASPDRFVRYRAARELERRDPAGWEPVALQSRSPLVRAEALVALARLSLVGPEPDPALPARVEACLALLQGKPDPVARLVALRALELMLLRRNLLAGDPRLLELFPTDDPAANRELALLIARTEPEGALAALAGELERQTDRVERIHLLYCLRSLRRGWSSARAEAAIRTLREAKSFAGGSSYKGYLEAIESDLRRHLDPAARGRLEQVEPPPAAPTPRPVAPRIDVSPGWDEARWTAFLERAIGAPQRSPAEGALVYRRACAACHRHGETPGGAGPDLTTVGRRLAVADLVASLVDPSRGVTEQYRSTVFRTVDQQTVEGVALGERDGQVEVLLADGRTTTLAAAAISSRKPATRSLMPEGLLDGLTREEAADLFAFLLADAPPAAPSAPAWRRLFDGATLSGWAGDPGLWRVEEGALVGRARDLPAASDLVADGEWRDFVLEADVNLTSGNSGIDFRAAARGDYRLEGLQADVSDVHWGELYRHGAGTVAAADPAARAAIERGGWNHYLIEARGGFVRLELNGVVSAQWTDPAPRGGRIGLQLHGAGTTIVRFRNVRIRPLDGVGK